MKKRNYEIPTMKVVQLHHRTHLLVGSEVTATSVSATMNGTWEEDEI